MWKAFSSWEPPEKKKKGVKEGTGAVEDSDEGVSVNYPSFFELLSFDSPRRARVTSPPTYV